MKSMTLHAVLSAVLAFLLLGCTTSAVEAQTAHQAYLDQTDGWIAESRGWMVDFEDMAASFPRPLPQLQADSAFRRHMEALEQHRMALLARDADLERLEEEQGSLGRSHARLRDAYRNMASLVEKGVKNSGPEFAKHEPQ
tara:strand:- start:112 stop:531 length:420 start_codon:yes stop_codon:yes gene_type:complete